MKLLTIFSLISLALQPVLACENCYGPRDGAAAHVRNVRRMQPGAPNATALPRGALAWGQLNFLHTTDTHGWLEGHLKEANYGADWGDYVSFTKRMKDKADNLGVDLLLIDTGVRLTFSHTFSCLTNISRTCTTETDSGSFPRALDSDDAKTMQRCYKSRWTSFERSL